MWFRKPVGGVGWLGLEVDPFRMVLSDPVVVGWD